jgi:hypothetical protein
MDRPSRSPVAGVSSRFDGEGATAIQDHRYWESHSALAAGGLPSAISGLCVWQATALQDHRYRESHSPLTGRGSWPSAISELCVWPDPGVQLPLPGPPLFALNHGGSFSSASTALSNRSRSDQAFTFGARHRSAASDKAASSRLLVVVAAAPALGGLSSRRCSGTGVT